MGIADQLDNENYLACINAHLIDNAHRKRGTLILLDEAQSMPKESLEAIRLLCLAPRKFMPKQRGHEAVARGALQ